MSNYNIKIDYNYLSIELKNKSKILFSCSLKARDKDFSAVLLEKSENLFQKDEFYEQARRNCRA